MRRLRSKPQLSVGEFFRAYHLWLSDYFGIPALKRGQIPWDLTPGFGTVLMIPRFLIEATLQ